MALFPPYLSIFLRVRRAEVSWQIPKSLRPREKAKLGNTLIYWDDENRSIWLRPRGLNLLQVPCMVARFFTDASGQSIVSQEIRFSPVFPVGMILILAVAYRFFAAMPAFPVPLGTFVAMAAGVFAVVGYVNLRIISSRMDRLIQETLPELGG